MSYFWVKQIKITDSVELANNLLQDGWRLIEVYTKIFVLGRGNK